MWDSLKPEILARLPRSTMNGTTNGSHAPSVLASPPTNWESCLEKLQEYRSYTDDWDGQGAAFGKPAAPITGEMIDSATALATSLRRVGVSAPDWTFPGVDGTVGFEWRLGSGDSISLEFRDPTMADVFFCAADNDVEHLILTEAVTV